MRYPFGGTLTDWTFSTGDTVTVGQVAGKNVVLVGGITVTFWDSEQGGNRYTDLLDDEGQPATSITSADGTGIRAMGQIPPFHGPDNDLKRMWAQAGDGPRVLIEAQLGEAVQTAVTAAASAQVTVAAHVGEVNPHGTGLADLGDTAVGTPASRTDAHVFTWDASQQRFVLSAPASVAGAVLLNPPKVGGAYIGNIAAPPDPTQGETGQPWLSLTQPFSSTDDNPDAIRYYSVSSSGLPIKTGWINGNGEGRFAPSLPNRVAFRVFEAYANRNGPSTAQFFQVSTNPLSAAEREPLVGVYGTAHASMPGWLVATRVMWGQLGIQVGGNYNSLTPVTLRGRRTSTGAPTSGSWTAGDVVMDSAGVLWLCTVGGAPGTWAGSGAAAPSVFVDIIPNSTNNIGHGAKHAATRLERGGDAARLRGTLTATGSVAQNTVLATIPTTAHRPKATVTTIARYSGGGAQFQITTNGELTLGSALTSGQSVWLDSITWDLEA